MTTLKTLDELKAIYGEANPGSIKKELDYFIPEYTAFLEASPFCTIATIGSEGVDCSPRGDVPGFVTLQDPKTLLMPDRKGNNRTDTLKNIVETGKVGLCFLVPGSITCLRVNGTAEVSVDPGLKSRFVMDGKEPRSVIVLNVEAVYFQCGRAILRSKLWDQDAQGAADQLPTPGDIMTAITNGDFDGKAYDEKWMDRAHESMW